MRKILPCLFVLLWQTGFVQNTGIGVGTATPRPSATLDVTSTIKSMLLPGMNSGQRTGIASPATGLFVFATDTKSFGFRTAAAWVELVDDNNSLLKKSGNNLYTTGNTQMGIGTSTPAYDLHLKQTNANIGLQDAATNRLSATITADDSDVVTNAFRGGTAGGDIILQRTSLVPASYSGNVGIVVPFASSPMEKLPVKGNLRLQSTSAELVLHNGTVEKGNLFISGNDIRLHTSAGNTTGRLIFGSQGATYLVLTPAGELNNPSDTSTSNVLPLAFGRVSSTGVIINSTGNFSVQHVSDGFYKITLPGESNVSANQSSYVVLVTPCNGTAVTGRGLMADVGIASDKIEVRLSRPKVNYDNDAYANSCGPFSYIQNIKFWAEVGCEFSLLVHKH